MYRYFIIVAELIYSLKTSIHIIQISINKTGFIWQIGRCVSLILGCVKNIHIFHIYTKQESNVIK